MKPLGRASGKSSSYEQALVATETLLREVAEDRWADWLCEDIRAWQRARDVSHHRRAYGGMGSFNDVFICRANHHRVTAEQEPWANSLFEWLKALLFYLSVHPTESPTSDVLHSEVSRDAPSLVAYAGEVAARTQVHARTGSLVKAAGVRCLSCGHAEMTHIEIDRAIADHTMPGVVFDACARGTLVDAVRQVLGISLPGVQDWRDRLRLAARAGWIQVRNREDRLHSCPQCGANTMAVYRWLYNPDHPSRFAPAMDNLPLNGPVV